MSTVEAGPDFVSFREGLVDDVRLIRPPTFEGTIGAIGATYLRLYGKGGRMTLAIDGQTQFLVNERPALITDLLPGDRATAEYAPNGGVALLLIVER